MSRWRPPLRRDALELSNEEILRYSRHLILPEVGLEGQQKLKARACCSSAWAGSARRAALYLAAAGVGTLGLVDFDVVDVTNLQRQILHGTSDVGKRKLDSARDRIEDLNPHVKVEAHETRAHVAQRARDHRHDYDIVIDGTDNFPTRYLVNDACVLLGKPNVYGSIYRFEGQASVFATEDAPCYRCLFREPPPPGLVPSCAEGGVLGVLPGLIGTIQATEAIKLHPRHRRVARSGRLLLVDALRMRSARCNLRKDPTVPGVRHARDHGAHRLRGVLRRPQAAADDAAAQSARAGDHAGAARGAHRARRRLRSHRRARAARVGRSRAFPARG